MKSVYTFIILLGLSTGLWAQKSIGPKLSQFLTNRSSSSQVLNHPQQSSSALAEGSCDTLAYPVPDEWNITAYYSQASNGTINGFITGANAYGDQEKAAFYDASQSADNFITKVWIAFAVANSNRSTNLTKIVPVHIYDGTTGEPGALLATVNKTLSELKADVDAGNYTEVNFPTAVPLPASKKFFVSVDLLNLTWSNSSTIGKDSLAIYSSDGDFTPSPDSDGFGWEKYDNSWETFNDGWGADFSLVIHPFVCTDAVLPIHLLSFNASRQGNTNVVNWTTATESGNAGFTLQRSADGASFTNIASLNSKAQGGNSSTPLTYSYNDSKDISANNYYRLKQTDISGNESYSAIVNVKAAVAQSLQIVKIWPSPATSYIKLVISSPSNEKLQLNVLDLSGKVVSQKMQQLSAGDNTVVFYINGLAPGTYFIKAGNSNTSTTIKKFVKE